MRTVACVCVPAVASHRYIVLSGQVGIFLEIPTDADGSSGPSAAPSAHKLIAHFSPASKSPWFGEAAILAGQGQPLPTRGASAFTLEQTQLLSVDRMKAGRFIDLLPEFLEMTAAYQKAYSKSNLLSTAKPLESPNSPQTSPTMMRARCAS